MQKRVRAVALLLVAVIVGFFAPVRGASADPANAEPAAGSIGGVPGRKVILEAGPYTGTTSVVGAEPARPRAQAANIVVTYIGFTQAAKDAFQRAVNILANSLNTPLTIRVKATFQSAPANNLGFAGPKNFFACTTPQPCGLPRSDTFYGSALADKLIGHDLEPGKPDVVSSFNSARSDWHFGSGPPPANRFDFTTVVLHELVHGVGFVGTFRKNGSSGDWGFTINNRVLPAIYDRFVANGANQQLIGGPFPRGSTALGNQLTSNNLFWSGLAKNLVPDGKLQLYAPNPFQPGSSISHFGEAKYPRGNPHSLETPQLGPGERILSFGAARGVLRNTGWN